MSNILSRFHVNIYKVSSCARIPILEQDVIVVKALQQIIKRRALNICYILFCLFPIWTENQIKKTKNMHTLNHVVENEGCCICICIALMNIIMWKGIGVYLNSDNGCASVLCSYLPLFSVLWTTTSKCISTVF